MTEAPLRHVPVMVGETMALLGAAPGRMLVDLTVGAGGHAEAFLRASAPTGSVLAADRDEQALELARERLAPYAARVRFLHGDAVTVLGQLAGEGLRPDAILLDLGLSSMQLDDAHRGFSLREDGPLDMRMDRRAGPTAADLVNGLPPGELAAILRDLGDEPAAEKIARAIVERRVRRPFRTTGDLRGVIELALGRRGGRVHPATRAFQALRIATNDEAGQLAAALPLARDLLAPGGRLAVISFHSGEDRVVKRYFAECGQAGDEPLTRRPVEPSREEQRTNRRSRSARLRVLRRSEVEGA